MPLANNLEEMTIFVCLYRTFQFPAIWVDDCNKDALKTEFGAIFGFELCQILRSRRSFYPLSHFRGTDPYHGSLRTHKLGRIEVKFDKCYFTMDKVEKFRHIIISRNTVEKESTRTKEIAYARVPAFRKVLCSSLIHCFFIIYDSKTLCLMLSVYTSRLENELKME